MTSTQNLTPQIIGTTIHDEQVVIHRASLNRYRIVLDGVTIELAGARYHRTLADAVQAARTIVPAHRSFSAPAASVAVA